MGSRREHRAASGDHMSARLVVRSARAYIPALDPAATLADVSTRAIARALKVPRDRLFPVALRDAVREMLSLIPVGAQLVPVPRASGCLAGNLLLAGALAEHLSRCSVVPALSRTFPVESSHLRRRRGRPGLDAAAHRASVTRTLPLDPNRPVVLVDNVVCAGGTGQGAADALGVTAAFLVTFAAAPVPAIECRADQVAA